MELNNVICSKYGHGYVKGIHCRMTKLNETANKNKICFHFISGALLISRVIPFRSFFKLEIGISVLNLLIFKLEIELPSQQRK